MNLLGVLGNPIAHSRSPQIHHYFARTLGLTLDYQKVLVEDGRFSATAQAFLARGAMGFNITLPHKHDAFLLADRVDAAAEIAQAVNTIKVEDDGSLSGFNTDGPGLVAAIVRRLGWVIQGKQILVLGAGGAVQSVMVSLLAESPASIHLYNRTEARAQGLVQRLLDTGCNDGRLACRRLDELASRYDLIISGSSAGLTALTQTPAAEQNTALPPLVIGPNSACFDMIYGTDVTPFMHWCRHQGARMTSDGLGMLVEQAALAFEIWFGRAVETVPLIQRLRASR